MKNIEQYLTDAASNCAVTINFPSSSTTFNERVIIATVFDEDFDEAKTFRFSMTEWQSVLEKSSQYDEPLHCDDCGIVTKNPWHASEGNNRHIHRCDTCQAKATDEIALLINQLVAQVEQLECQLAGCGVAAFQNTHDSASERAVPGDYGYSVSYEAVCRAVDREMALREQRDVLLNTLQQELLRKFEPGECELNDRMNEFEHDLLTSVKQALTDNFEGECAVHSPEAVKVLDKLERPVGSNKDFKNIDYFWFEDYLELVANKKQTNKLQTVKPNKAGLKNPDDLQLVSEIQTELADQISSVQPQNSTSYVVTLGKDDDDKVIFTCTANSFDDAASKAEAVYPHLETLHIEQTDSSVKEAWERIYQETGMKGGK